MAGIVCLISAGRGCRNVPVDASLACTFGLAFMLRDPPGPGSSRTLRATTAALALRVAFAALANRNASSRSASVGALFASAMPIVVFDSLAPFAAIARLNASSIAFDIASPLGGCRKPQTIRITPEDTALSLALSDSFRCNSAIFSSYRCVSSLSFPRSMGTSRRRFGSSEAS